MSTPRKRRARAGGFLLVETLATFTISAFVLLGLVASASVILRAVDGSTSHVASVDDLGRAMDALGRDLGEASRARWSGFEPQDFVFDGGPDGVTFAHRDRASDGSSAMHVVSLREVRQGARFVLMRADAPLPPDATGFGTLTFGERRAIPTGVFRLRFSYVRADPKGRAGTRVPVWAQGATMPTAIVVEAVNPESGLTIVSSLVTLRADADIGCVGDPDAPVVQVSGAVPPVDPASQQAAGAQAPGVQTPLVQTPTGTPAPPPPGAPNAADDQAFCGREDKGGAPDQAGAAGAPTAAPDAGAPGGAFPGAPASGAAL